MWSVPDTVKAQSCFDHALTIARQQEAKSWELRAAMSMARLWRDQGKPQQARELLFRHLHARARRLRNIEATAGARWRVAIPDQKRG
jgi:predicted NAD/FAD-dependent oxidoreductase